MNHLEDPTAEQYGGRIPIPAKPLKSLTEQAQAGVEPDFVWIGHQFPDDYKHGNPLPRLVPEPHKLRKIDAWLTRWLTKVTGWFFKGTVTTLAVAAAPSLVLAGAAASVGRDPIIFGGVKHPDLPYVMWCVLAQWEWE